MLDVGTDTSYAIWQTIAHHLGGEYLGSIRAVCRMSRKAVDEAVTSITVPGDTIESALPRWERFPACKQYTFIETSEELPQYVKQYCGPPSKQTSVLVCGEACWKQFCLQDWLELYGDATWVGLVLRLCEDHQDADLSVYLDRILNVESGTRLSLLGLWCGVRFCFWPSQRVVQMPLVTFTKVLSFCRERSTLCWALRFIGHNQ